MPPTSRGWPVRRPFQSSICTTCHLSRATGLRFSSTNASRTRYTPPKRVSAPTPPNTSLRERLKNAFKAIRERTLRPFHTVFRPISRQISRIPARYRRFIGTTLQLTPIFLLVGLHFPYQVMLVNGSSMSPFLNANNAPHLPKTRDRILVKRLAIQVFDALGGSDEKEDKNDPLRRGDIVVFYTPHDPNKVAVKRVVAIAGDKVMPLAGYDGPSEVVVQHHHLWVEGDVDDRERSRDSNWYGQISQNLVIGRVIAIMQPWWRPRWLDITQHTYPARRKNRVVEDAVAEEKTDLDERSQHQGWIDGRAETMLQSFIQQRTAYMNRLIKSAEARDTAAYHYSIAINERMRNDPQTRGLAGDIVEQLAAIFDETGFIPVQNEEGESTLQPTETAHRLVQEYQYKKRDEGLSSEEMLRRNRLAYEQAYAKEEQELERFDDWSWWSKYRPKSVLSNKIARSKEKWMERQAKAEEELRQQQEMERLGRSHLTANLVGEK